MFFITLYLLSIFSPSLSAWEINQIKTILSTYSVTPKELSFEKKWATDSTFLLKRVAQSLDDPLWLPFYLDSTVSFLSGVYSELGELKKESLPPLKGLLFKIFYHLANEINYLPFPIPDISYKKAVTNLSEEELDYLLYHSPNLFSDEEAQSDDYLKGLLHKEFSRPIKFDTIKVPSDSFFEVVKKVQYNEIIAASASSLKRFFDDLANSPFSPYLKEKERDFKKTEIPGIQGKVYYYTENEWGKVVIGSEEDNCYLDKFDLIIDLGGNDIYYSRNSAIGFLSSHFSAIIDFEGNDLYQSERPFSFGGSIFGTSLLIDLKGNDTYRAAEFSLGSSLFGLGILIDMEGDDQYLGKTFTQGSGFYGVGALLDLKGNDTYRADNFAQGFGSTFGYGCLADFSGEDVYYAGGKFYHAPLLAKDFRSFAQGFAMGFRPDAGGGIGLLYDKKGNDFYNGDVYTQGASYWYALGMLFDEEGQDKYSATEYAQGAGIHLASGILIDQEGDDCYYSRLGPAQGEGHDLSVGILIDKKGNDFYYTSGGQGIGLTNSFGLFLDSEGDDSYLTREKEFGQGWANLSRGFGGFGIFLDLQGSDIYPPNSKVKENSYFTQGFYGAGADLRGEKDEKKETETPVPESLDDKSIEEIFKGASEWEVGSARERVRKYRKELIKRDTIAIRYILEKKIDTKNSLELRAIEEVSCSLPEKIKPYLFKYLRDGRRYACLNVIYLLGKIKARDAVDSLILALKDKRNRPRWIISALGDIGKPDSVMTKEDTLLRRKIVSVILTYTKDRYEPTRITATVALGKIKEESGISALIQNLSDPVFTIRQAAENSLVEIGEKAIEPLISYLTAKKVGEGTGVVSALRSLGKIARSLKEEKELLKKQIRKEIIPFLSSPKTEIRLSAVEALANFPDEYTKHILKIRLEEETNPIVLDKLKAVLNEY